MNDNALIKPTGGKIGAANHEIQTARLFPHQVAGFVKFVFEQQYPIVMILYRRSHTGVGRNGSLRLRATALRYWGSVLSFGNF